MIIILIKIIKRYEVREDLIVHGQQVMGTIYIKSMNVYVRYYTTQQTHYRPLWSDI